MGEKSSRLYVIKTAPGREKNVADAIGRYYLCGEGQKPGEIITDITVEDVTKPGKVGTARRIRIPKKERLEMKKAREEELAKERGVDVEEIRVKLSEIPQYREKKKRKSALGFFGLELAGKEKTVERKVCLVNDVVMPDLKGYIVIDAHSKKEAREVVRRLRHAWKLLDGTVPRKEIELNIRRIEEASHIEVGDIVIPKQGSFEGIRAEVEGFTPDGRLKLKTTGEVIKLRFTLGRDSLIKE